tara:strand:- start:475 stop:1482 length:1008 start_codon:yes stop_codon:yes gene_type:complete
MNLNAQGNSDLSILGNWMIESSTIYITYFIDQEELDQIQSAVDMDLITADDFMDEMGFPMPTSQEEWDYLASNGITTLLPEEENDLDITAFGFTENMMTLVSEDIISLSYNWNTDSTISLEAIEDFPFTEFTINDVNDEMLSLSSSVTIMEEDDMLTIYDLVFNCVSTDAFILGCTDPEALNYNMEANLNDGSCSYPYLCGDDELLLILEDDESDGWEGSELIVNEISYTLMNGNEDFICIPSSDCFTFSTIEGDYMEEATWSISNENELFFEGGLPFTTSDLESACLALEELNEATGKIMKVVDVLGRIQTSEKKGSILFYIYENGTVVKRINR